MHLHFLSPSLDGDDDLTQSDGDNSGDSVGELSDDSSSELGRLKSEVRVKGGGALETGNGNKEGSGWW
ncbi:hypothetical protein RJT34_30459 [Clitoria ternatea]|uniref:Uncharacterized protein n=1 Tax=Clitoria ternatea TaxID=43366 RepID=A0AAN9F051_CLITE